MTWYQLTLISAFSIALADSVMKKYLSPLSAWDLVLVRFAIPGILLLPYALHYPMPGFNFSFLALMLLLVTLEIGAMMIYVHAVANNPLHLTLPYLAFTPIFNILTGYIFLGERISVKGGLGIVIVVLGSYILNITREFNLKRVAEPLTMIWKNQGSRLMLLCSFIYSLTSTLSKKAMQYADAESFGAYYFVIIGAAVWVIYPWVRRKNPKQILRKFVPVMGVAILMSIMVVTHFIAIANVQVAYMISVKRSSLLFGILMGALFFGERNLLRNLIGGSIILTGIVLLLN